MEENAHSRPQHEVGLSIKQREMTELSIEKAIIQAKILQTEHETLLPPGSTSNDVTEDESEREARENLYKQLTEFCRDGMLENGHVSCDHVRQRLIQHYTAYRPRLSRRSLEQFLHDQLHHRREMQVNEVAVLIASLLEKVRRSPDSAMLCYNVNGKRRQRCSLHPHEGIWPYAIIVISILQIVMYVHLTVSSDNDYPLYINLFRYWATYTSFQRHQLWRFATTNFVHIGVWHLAINVIAQLILATILYTHTQWQILIVYLIGATSGVILNSIVEPNLFVLVGASGGAMALLSVNLADLLINWYETPQRWRRLRIVMIGTFFVSTACTAFDILCTYIVPEVQVGYWSNIGGFVAGFLVSVLVLQHYEQRKHRRLIWWLALSTYIFLLMAALAWHLSWPYYLDRSNRALWELLVKVINNATFTDHNIDIVHNASLMRLQ